MTKKIKQPKCAQTQPWINRGIKKIKYSSENKLPRVTYINTDDCTSITLNNKSKS